MYLVGTKPPRDDCLPSEGPSLGVGAGYTLTGTGVRYGIYHLHQGSPTTLWTPGLEWTPPTWPLDP